MPYAQNTVLNWSQSLTHRMCDQFKKQNLVYIFMGPI